MAVRHVEDVRTGESELDQGWEGWPATVALVALHHLPLFLC